MKTLNRYLTSLGEQQDAALFMLLIMVVVMMILPVPSLVMDVLIAANLGLAVLIVLVTLTAQRALDFSTFPSIILIATLFRLAISISTTRLILKDGEAGQIIETFGEQVIAGNLVVGLVIFLIITVVQFLVITKGADRVAEVSARFTLDGMPGKQMSVDADLRAGNIDQLEAQERRGTLELESKLFGAMDGAMKFVKGDAIAGLVITAINLIGGIVIGNVQRGLSMSEAVEVYSLLTIGDGLVAQIPALLISIASGTLVTRVTADEDATLSVDMGKQIFGGAKTRKLAGAVLIGFGFVPGFPVAIFGLLGLGLVSSGFYKSHIERRAVVASDKTSSWDTFFEFQARMETELQKKNGASPTVSLRMPHAIKSFDCLRFVEAFDRVQEKLSHASGLDLGHWKVELSSDPDVSDCRITLNRTLLHEYRVEPEALFVRMNESQLVSLAFKPFHATSAGAWLPAVDAGRLDEHGIVFHDAMEILMFHLTDAVRAHLAIFVTVQAIASSMSSVEKSMPVLIEEVKGVCPNGKLVEVVRRLVEEDISVANFALILEAILEWAPKEADTVALAEYVRGALSSEISQQYATNGFQNVILVAPSTEAILRDALRTTPTGSFLVLPPDTATGIVQQVGKFFESPHRGREDPVLLTHMDIRRHLKQLLEHRGIKLPVLSFQEIPAAVTIYPVGFIK